MRLSLAPVGEVNQIKAIWVEEESKNILESFGLTIDSEVRVISKVYGSVIIVCVKDKYIAIEEELACKILV